MPTTTATQKQPTPAAAPPPPAQSKATGASGPKPAPQTGIAAQDGFDARPQQAIQKAQGDAFQAPTKAPVALQAPQILDQKAGGGAVQAPVDMANLPVTDKAVLKDALLKDPKFASAIQNNTLLRDPELMGKLEALSGKPIDLLKKPDPNDPTKGMTEQERTAYDALPPDQKQHYDELHQQAAAAWPRENGVQELRDLLTKPGQWEKYLTVEKSLEGNPQAQADLQKLLFNGKLNESSSELRSTLDYLSDLAEKGGQTEPLGVDRQELLVNLLHDLADPRSIKQGENNADCGGTAAAIGMAATDPAEYARVITQLAETGQANLTPLWGQIMGKPDCILKVDPPLQHDRSLTQELFAKPFVDSAAGTSPIEQMIVDMFGLNGTEMANQLNDADYNGGGWDTVYMPPADDPRSAEAQQAAQAMLEGATREKPMFAIVDGHWVTVNEVKDGVVHYVDGNGKECEAKVEDFMKGLNTIAYQEGDGRPTPPDYMHDKKWGHRGGGGSSSGSLGPGGNKGTSGG